MARFSAEAKQHLYWFSLGAMGLAVLVLLAGWRLSGGTASLELLSRGRWGLESGPIDEVTPTGDMQTVGRYIVMGPLVLRTTTGNHDG